MRLPVNAFEVRSIALIEHIFKHNSNGLIRDCKELVMLVDGAELRLHTVYSRHFLHPSEKRGPGVRANEELIKGSAKRSYCLRVQITPCHANRAKGNVDFDLRGRVICGGSVIVALMDHRVMQEMRETALSLTSV